MHYIPLLYVAFAAHFTFQTNSFGPLAEQIPPVHAKSTYSNTCCKCAANELCKVPKVFFSFTESRKRPRSSLLTLKCRFVHASHARAVMLAREALNVHLQWNGAYWWSEVEQTHLQGNIFSKLNLELSNKLLFCFSTANIHNHLLKHFLYLINI